MNTDTLVPSFECSPIMARSATPSTLEHRVVAARPRRPGECRGARHRLPAALSGAALAALVLARTGGAIAAEGPLENDGDTPWRLDVGLALDTVPLWSGSSRYDSRLLPVIEGHLGIAEDTALFVAGDASGVQFSVRPDLEIGLAIRADAGRAEDAVEPEGVREVDDALQFGVFAELGTPERLRVGASAFADVAGDREGALAALEVSRALRPNGWPSLLLSAGVELADRERADTFYGVRTTEARPGRAAYAIGAGATSVHLSLVTTYRFTRRWSLRIAARTDRLVGEAARSPLVESRDRIATSLELRYGLGPFAANGAGR